MSAPRISAVVICCDEERHIGECLASVDWCGELVVVDSGSADRTVEIARAAGARVIERGWPGHVAQKQFALEQAQGDWVFSLDADERCTPELRAEIERVTGADASAPEAACAGFEMRRIAFHLGRWIRHGGWYPDWKLRLVRRGRAHIGGRNPHDRMITDGPVGRLDADLLHFAFRDFAAQIRTIQSYTDIMAAELFRAGKRFSLPRAVLHSFFKFVGCYLWKSGWRDGWPGFVIAAASAFAVFARYVKLWELERAARSG